MTQKNTFKSVPLYDSGNCLYQRRTQKCSNSPMINSPRNINRLSSEKYFGANCAKDRIREMPVELCSSEDTLVTNRTGSCFNPDRSEELSIINRHYQSMPSSANSGSSCPKSNYSTGEVSAKKHIENYHRSSGVTFRENDQQYSSESDANVSNKYYPDRSNMLSERKKMQYHRTENENNQKELMESGKIWNRRVFERKLGESYEKKFNEEKIEHHSVGQIHGFQMSSGLDSDIKFGRNPSPPLSEDYEENYLDTQMANRREETLTRPDHYEERQNLIEVHEDDIDQSVYVENPDNQEFEYGSQDTKNTNKNEGMDYACAGNWERVYKKPQTDKFANIYPSVVHQKMLCPKSVIEEPYPVSKSSKPLPYSLSKQIKPLSNPQQSSFFPESTNSQIYYSPGPTNPQSTSALPYQKSLQVSGGLQSTQFNITSDISEREMETSRENFKIYQQNFARSDTHQGELVSPPNKSLQKSVMMKKSSKPSRRDGIKAFESACGGIVTIVVLKGFPKKKMMPSELNKLETAILNEMDKIPEGAFHPRFVEYNKKRGSLIIVSENRYAANWLENVVGILEPWEGARFKTIEREQEPILWLSIFSSDPKVLLNCQQLDRVQNAIMDKIDIVDGGFQPELLDCYQKHQSLVVACNNRKTADWLKKTVQTLEPWENAQLACIDPTELGGYKKFKMDIVPWDDPNKILDRIESQNDNLCTGSWKIIHSKVGRNRHVGVLVVAVKKSLLDVLRGVDFRPFLNLRRVFMQEVGDYNLF